MGKHRKDQPPEQPVAEAAVGFALDLRTRGFEQRVVLHARRACGDARHAAEARVDVPDEAVAGGFAPVAPQLHQVNASSGRIRLLPPQHDTSGRSADRNHSGRNRRGGRGRQTRRVEVTGGGIIFHHLTSITFRRTCRDALLNEADVEAGGFAGAHSTSTRRVEILASRCAHDAILRRAESPADPAMADPSTARRRRAPSHRPAARAAPACRCAASDRQEVRPAAAAYRAPVASDAARAAARAFLRVRAHRACAESCASIPGCSTRSVAACDARMVDHDLVRTRHETQPLEHAVVVIDAPRGVAVHIDERLAGRTPEDAPTPHDPEGGRQAGNQRPDRDTTDRSRDNKDGRNRHRRSRRPTKAENVERR